MRVTRLRVARVVSEVVSPVVLVGLVTVIVAVDAAGAARGIGLALVAILFAAGLPYTLVLVGVRRGVITDHHVSRREQRPALMAVALASVAAGLLVLRWLGAPRELFALVAAMAAGLVLSVAVSSFWKISIHAAAAAGTVCALAILVNPWWWLASPLAALTGWARVEVRAHSPAQVWAGLVVGAMVTAGVCVLLT